MKKILSIITTALLIASLSIACFAGEKTTLTISVAASLKDVLTEASTLYKKSHSALDINFNFGASGALSQQIENGAHVDIFISASKKFVDKLQAVNLVTSENIKTLTSTKVVLVTPLDNLTIKNFKDLTKPEVKMIAMGEPASVPAGQYGMEVLSYYQIADQLKSKLVYGKDVRSVLNYVALGNADAGIVYYADAISSDKVKITEISPDNAHTPVKYISAILANQQESRSFITFLVNQPELFKKYGFIGATKK